MGKTKRKGSKGRSTKRRSTKRRSTRRRRSKRGGANRGGGNTVAKRSEKPAEVFEDGGYLFSDELIRRMTNGEAFYINGKTKTMSLDDFFELLNEDIDKKRTEKNSRSFNDTALGGTVLHTLVDKIYDLSYKNFKMITDAIFSNEKINEIINKKNDNGKTALEVMVAEIVSRGSEASNFKQNHRKYLAKKLSDVPGLVIPEAPTEDEGVDATAVNAAIELIEIANKDATYVAPDMKPTKSATAVKAAVTSDDGIPSFKGNFS